MSTSYVPLAVQVLVPAADDDDLQQLGAISDVDVTETQEVAAPRDLFFDVEAGIAAVKTVTAVISGIGGALKVIDWVVTWLRERRGKVIVLKVGGSSVTVHVGDDAEQTRKLLETALQIV